MLAKIHPESFLNIALVQHFFNDPSVQFVSRAIDNNWFYEDHLETSIVGFNPLISSIFYSQISNFSNWKSHKGESARKYNFEDNLVHEVMFAVHDYLHMWAYQAIHHLMPELKVGVEPITAKNIDDMVYLHLLTETVATVGMDYWYFCNLNLNELISLGSKKEALATKYHSRELPEFKRFNKKFNPMSLEFFAMTDKIYAYSEVKGFSAASLEKSPMILSWMKHEYKYGETQRRLTRQWLMSLSPEPIKMNMDLTGPLTGRQSWKRELSQEIGKLLWQKVVENKPIYFKPLPSRGLWKPRTDAAIYDYRFFNINSFGTDFWDNIAESFYPADSAKALFSQIISKYRLEDIDPVDIEIIMKYKEQINISHLRHLFKNYKTLKTKSAEPANVFLAG